MEILKKIILLLMLSLVIISCEESNLNDDDGQTAPELPPVSSFVIDFSDFPTTTKSAIVDDTTRKNNFQTASLQVGWWNTLITIGMAVPVLSFLESFKHEVVREDINWWTWTYDFTAQKVKHTAVLHGKVNVDSVTWEMYITKENVYENFMWYWGRGDILGTGGYWILQEKPEKRVDILKIDWERNPIDSTGNIRYMNIEKGGNENGGYILYGVSLEQSYNAYYHIYNKGQDNLSQIEWDTETLIGRIINKKAFIDEEWHCWDEDQYNTQCD